MHQIHLRNPVLPIVRSENTPLSWWRAGLYDIISDADAHSVAKYVWNNYPGGRSKSCPLGPAVLDGVDFDIEASVSPYWASLAKHLKGYSSRILLTAAPHCPFPDAYMGPGPHTALKTGLFDYAWVQFYNNPPCDYGGSRINGILDALEQRTNQSVPRNTRIFLGLPATPDAAPSGGFLPPKVLKAQVLPRIKKSRMYVVEPLLRQHEPLWALHQAFVVANRWGRPHEP